ncbi:MAG: PAS domain-containing sensor histidine kinase [Allosphingosinicella sp.]
MTKSPEKKQKAAEQDVENFHRAMGPFVVAAETTRMAMVFTNAKSAGHPIIYANESFLALTGYGRDEVLAQDFNFVLAHAADANALARIAEAFRAETGNAFEIECRRKDGRTFLAAVFISPVRNKPGDVVQHFASFVDLTDHLDRVRREREAFNTLYQDAPGFIATMEGADHRFTYVNTAYQQLVGHRPMVGRTVAEAFPELVGQGFISLLDDVYATGQPYRGNSMALKIQDESGAGRETRFVDFVYQPMRDSRDRVTGVFCEGHDVTEHQLALQQVLSLQEELIHLSRLSAMGTMAATLAHELNQPLAAISNYMAGCRRVMESGATNVQVLETGLKAIGESSERAGQIIRRLKDMTQRRKTQHETFELAEAVAEAIELVRAAGFDKVAIHATSSGRVVLHADRVQIQQVIMNLVRNACEAVASSGNGEVTVSTAVKRNRAIVSVDDTGPGVPPEVARTLFHWSDSTKPDGMGVGLSICRTIIEGHRGKIWLDETSDEGTRFCFSLPLAKQSTGDAASEMKLQGRR